MAANQINTSSQRQTQLSPEIFFLYIFPKNVIWNEMLEYADEFFRIAISFQSLHANYSIQFLYCQKMVNLFAV